MQRSGSVAQPGGPGSGGRSLVWVLVALHPLPQVVELRDAYVAALERGLGGSLKEEILALDARLKQEAGEEVTIQRF